MINKLLNCAAFLTILALAGSGCALVPGQSLGGPKSLKVDSPGEQVTTPELALVQEAQKATERRAKAVTEEQIKQSHRFRIREYLEAANKKRMAVFLNSEAIRDDILVETLIDQGPEVRACYILGEETKEVYSRGGKMEQCKAYRLQRFSDQTIKTSIDQSKKLYNQALDMDPNNVQALVGIANLYIIQAVDAQYRRIHLRLMLERLLVQIRPNGKATGDILAMSYSELISKVRPKSNPSESQRKEIREFLWEGTNNKHQIDSFLRAANARCEDALRVNAQFAPAHLGLVVAAAVANKWKVAIAKLSFLEENKFEIRRNRSMFYVWKGFVLERMGSYSDALKAYGTAIELDEPFYFMDFPRERIRSILLSQKPS